MVPGRRLRRPKSKSRIREWTKTAPLTPTTTKKKMMKKSIYSKRRTRAFSANFLYETTTIKCAFQILDLLSGFLEGYRAVANKSGPRHEKKSRLSYLIYQQDLLNLIKQFYNEILKQFRRIKSIFTNC